MRKGVLLVGLLFAVLIISPFSTRNVSALANIGLSISTSDGTMSGATDHQATFLVTVVNNDPSGSLVRHVFLTLDTPVLPSGGLWDPASPPATVVPLPVGWTYSFSLSEFDVDPGQSKQSTLTITGTAGTPPGLIPFTVIGYWIDHVIDNTGIHNVYTLVRANGRLTIIVKLMIPEYWLGTILGLVGMFAAFGARYFQKRKQFSP
jgi:hypothetical protein